MMRGRRRRREGRRWTLSRATLFRLLLVVPFVVAAGWLSVGVSGSNILRLERPDRALSFQPADARARAKASEQIFLLAQGRPPQRPRPLTEPELAAMEQLARDALRRDPTVVMAWRMLGVAAAARNQAARAARMFHFAGTLSKRDLPTQLYLIEERVQQNDIGGALRQYDATLRTSGASHEILLPILVSAIGNDGIVEPLAALLNSGPPWRRAFMERLAAGTPDPAGLVQLIQLTHGSASPEEKAQIATAMQAMINRRQFAPAMRVYQLLAAADSRGSQLLRNGGFDRPNPYPPLDWQLLSGVDVGGEQQSDRLRIHAASGSGGLAARQLLLLAPGNYEISADAGATDDARAARVTWTVQCGGNDQGIMLLEQDLPALSGRIRARASFSVPAGCGAQWLRLNIRPDFDPGGVAAWIDSFALRRLGG
ncbi:MAG TPA: hypothetical protein VGO55_11155 [Allosphingosinicella sp.]|jgi:hypothetical protein|nr:hypothetical protein [Allosphingosinicella sp.]